MTVKERARFGPFFCFKRPLAYEYNQAHITSNGVYQSLRQKVVDAQKELDKGKLSNAAQKVSDFIGQVEKETGKGTITKPAAVGLNAWAGCGLATLKK